MGLNSFEFWKYCEINDRPSISVLCVICWQTLERSLMMLISFIMCYSDDWFYNHCNLCLIVFRIVLTCGIQVVQICLSWRRFEELFITYRSLSDLPVRIVFRLLEELKQSWLLLLFVVGEDASLLTRNHHE